MGVELRSPRTFLDRTLRPVAAVDVQYRKQNNWHTDLFMRAGVHSRSCLSSTRKSAAAGVLQRLLANGQFYRERIEYVGRGIHFYLYRRSALEPVERQPAPAGTGEGISTSRSSPWQAWVSHQGQRRAVLRSRARATDRGTRVRSLATRRRDGFGHRPRPTRCGRRCLMPPRRGQASRSDVVGNPQFAPDVSGA
jgi:Protein of unknown function (DUF1207)